MGIDEHQNREFAKTIIEEHGTEQTPEEKTAEAKSVLKDVLEKFSGNTSMIPMEDYETYQEAAEIYIKRDELHPTETDENLLLIAKAIVAESPLTTA